MVQDLNAQIDQSSPLPQFLFPSFTKSLVKMKDGRQLSASINYNMVDEEMIFDQKGIYMALEKPQEIDTIYIQNRKFVPVEKAFYEVLVNGQVTIFIQHKSRYAPVGSNTAYGLKTQTLGPSSVQSINVGNQTRQINVPENVTVSPATLYWAKINGTMNKFTNEKQFLKLFPDKEARLKEFMKDSDLDIKVREDLIKLGNFCNGLVE
jgi:hypothetical protein